MDGAILQEVAKERENIEIAYLENANHVMKYEPKPRAQLTGAEAMATYSADGIGLDPDAVETILSWLGARR